MMRMGLGERYDFADVMNDGDTLYQDALKS